MNKNNLFTEERAVSPVIGVILMVAITVILAAVIGTFVLGIAPGDDPAPSAQISIQGDAGHANVTLHHNGGDTLTMGDHSVLVNGSSEDGNTSMTGSLSAGERLVVEDLATGNNSDVTLRHDPSGSIIASNTVDIEDDP